RPFLQSQLFGTRQRGDFRRFSLRGFVEEQIKNVWIDILKNPAGSHDKDRFLPIVPELFDAISLASKPFLCTFTVRPPSKRRSKKDILSVEFGIEHRPGIKVFMTTSGYDEVIVVISVSPADFKPPPQP